MVLLKLIIFTLTLYELIANLDALICPKGQRVVRHGSRRTACEDCPSGTYHPVENDSQHCRACTKCDEKSGSVFIEKCTKVKNAKCQCRGEFVPSDGDSSTCKCDIGFGLKPEGCSKCDEGYFSTSINSPCQKLKECKSTGVNITGTKTSDAICNEESNTSVTTTPTSIKTVSLITHLTSQRPHEGAQTQKIHTTTTTSVPGHSPKNKMEPSYPTGMVILILIFGILGLLVLTAVTCKLHITPRMERQSAIQKSESLCRSPVEESGGGSLSSLSKLNPEEP